MKKSSGNVLVLIGACAAPSLVAAFGLGEAEVRSDIGQPLNVTIPVTLERNENLSRLQVQLASPASYVDAGLEWPAVLNRAVVTLEQGRDGSPFVRIHSEERVMEPILPLLMEAHLGQLGLHRDYAVLLDLPTVMARVQVARPVLPPDPGTLAVKPFGAPEEGASAATPGVAHAAPPARAARQVPPTVGNRTTVAVNESLGELAQRVRPDPNIPLRRMMAAIYAANPGAFGNDVDHMWAGSEIRVPPVEQIQELAHTVDLTSGVRYRSHRPQLRVAETPAAGFAAPAGAPWSPSHPTLKVIGALGSLPGFGRTIVRTLHIAESLASLPSEDEMLALAARLAPAKVIVASPAPQESTAVQAPEPGPALPAATAAAAPGPAAALTGAAPLKAPGFFFYAFLALLGWIAARRFSLRERIEAAIEQWRRSREPVQAPQGSSPPASAPLSRTILPVEISAPEARAAERLMSVAPEMVQAPDLAASLPAKPEPAPTPAAPAVAAAPPVAAPTPAPGLKLVPTKRREDSAIEVSEMPAAAAGGGLNGFYADVAQMLASALEQDPRRRDLRLKLLEVYFSAGLVDEYLSQTRAYLEEVRGQADDSWSDIASMGRKLVPGHEWFSLGIPPRLPAAGSEASAAAAAKRNFNRYYEGVDQWRLRGALEELNQQYKILARDPSFATMQSELLQQLAGRPTLLVHAAGLSQKLGGAQIYLKREPRHGSGDDHLINAIGQAALARRMNRRGVVAATSNGLHGLAVAAVARALKLECTIVMEDKDVRAHYPRVMRMREFGAKIDEIHQNPALPGDIDVRRSALNAWLENPKETLYISSLSSGPHPYPMIMQDCQAVVGRETRNQLHIHSSRPPAAVIAGTADGPGVIGLLHSFIDETQTRLYCVESSRNGSLRDRVTIRNDGPDLELTEHNWPREHNWLKETKRVTYGRVSETEAILAMQQAYETEKLMLSQEGAQVVAYASRVAKEFRQDQTVVVLLPSQNDADARLMENAGARQIPRLDIG